MYENIMYLLLLIIIFCSFAIIGCICDWASERIFERHLAKKERKYFMRDVK